MRFFALHFGLDAIPSLRTKQKNKKNEKEGLTRIIRTINLLSVNCSRRGSTGFGYKSLFNAEVASKGLFSFQGGAICWCSRDGLANKSLSTRTFESPWSRFRETRSDSGSPRLRTCSWTGRR